VEAVTTDRQPERPWYAAPSTARGRGVALGLGLVLGVGLTLLAQILLAPQPAAVHPASEQEGVAITVDDATLTRLAAAGIARAGLPFAVTNVQAHVLPSNVVTISGDVPALGLFGPRRLAASAQVVPTAGRLALHITNASVGGLTLPSALTGVLESALDDRLATLTDTFTVLGTHYQVVGARSSPGSLTLMLAAT
jgi:hypothetical protein